MKLRLIIVALAAILTVFVAPAAADIVLYTNGPINGTIGAYSITGAYGWEVANSFTLAGSSTVTGFDIGAWVLPGDQPFGVTWEILTGGPDWLGGTVVASGNANFANTYWGSGFDYYDIYTSKVGGLNVNLGAGNYWLELLNGTTLTSGNPIYWDENDGQSTAYQINTGQVGSEAFNIYGTTASGTVPEPSSILLFGSGLLALAGILRRKLF